MEKQNRKKYRKDFGVDDSLKSNEIYISQFVELEQNITSQLKENTSLTEKEINNKEFLERNIGSKNVTVNLDLIIRVIDSIFQEYQTNYLVKEKFKTLKELIKYLSKDMEKQIIKQLESIEDNISPNLSENEIFLKKIENSQNGIGNLDLIIDIITDIVKFKSQEFSTVYKSKNDEIRQILNRFIKYALKNTENQVIEQLKNIKKNTANNFSVNETTLKQFEDSQNITVNLDLVINTIRNTITLKSQNFQSESQNKYEKETITCFINYILKNVETKLIDQLTENEKNIIANFPYDSQFLEKPTDPSNIYTIAENVIIDVEEIFEEITRIGKNISLEFQKEYKVKNGKKCDTLYSLKKFVLKNMNKKVNYYYGKFIIEWGYPYLTSVTIGNHEGYKSFLEDCLLIYHYYDLHNKIWEYENFYIDEDENQNQKEFGKIQKAWNFINPKNEEKYNKLHAFYSIFSNYSFTSTAYNPHFHNQVKRLTSEKQTNKVLTKDEIKNQLFYMRAELMQLIVKKMQLSNIDLFVLYLPMINRDTQTFKYKVTAQSLMAIAYHKLLINLTSKIYGPQKIKCIYCDNYIEKSNNKKICNVCQEKGIAKKQARKKYEQKADRKKQYGSRENAKKYLKEIHEKDPENIPKQLAKEIQKYDNKKISYKDEEPLKKILIQIKNEESM